jgi:hypothetical protein
VRFSLLPVWLRAAIVAAAALFVVATPTTLHASVIYDFSLVADPGMPYSGTGFMVLSSTVPSSGQVDFTPGSGLLDLSFTLDGQTFDMHDVGVTGSTLVRFLNGAINDITFADQIGVTPYRFALHSTAGYIFYYNNEQALSTGKFANLTLDPAGPPSVPEPSSIAMLGTGLLAGAGSLYRRFTCRS